MSLAFIPNSRSGGSWGICGGGGGGGPLGHSGHPFKTDHRLILLNLKMFDKFIWCVIELHKKK